MKYLFTGLIITSLLVSCSQHESSEASLTSGLYLENMDTTVSPGDNFQMFVNGTWIEETEMPSDKSRYGVFHMLHEASQENVRTIIEESASGDFEEGSDEQKVGDLYASFLDLESRNAQGIDPLLDEISKIDALTDIAELASFFAYLETYGLDVPIGLFVYPNMKESSTYALYNWQGGLALPDREYYLKEDERSAEIREEYVKHIATMFELAGFENPGESASTILEIETTLAQVHWKKEDTRDMVAMFNYWPVDSLDALMPNFSWVDYLEEAGVYDLQNIVVTQPSYILALDDILASTSLDDWKTYLRWTVLHENASRLSEEFDQENFAFYGTFMRGTPEQLPAWRRAVNTVNGNLGEIVGKVYVARHFPPEAKARMEEMVDDLILAYEESINNLDWMGTETRIEALDKLSKFTPKIGYPEVWKDYSDVEIVADDLYANIRSAKLAKHRRDMAKVEEPVDKNEWSMTPQTVNAYYSPAKNEIVFPAAILQPPFFDLNADDAVNYGAIGGVIGHEIGHGFDDKGSTFDGNGMIRDWWTKNDREEFEVRTERLIEQYNAYEVLDNIFVNGEYTLGENIGDLGGLSIALKAYLMSREDEEIPVMDGYSGIQRVFLGWAQAWKNISREEALEVQVKTDPHAPADFRVNGVVRNIPEFYEAFNVQPGDSLYLPPEERVKIW